jgi:uncharacterized protein YndB with AHSA1/START domain
MSIVNVERDLDSLTLTIVAEFAAPIARVWQLWADPRQLERWWGPPSHPATFVRHELTVGGGSRYFMTGPEGETSHGWWEVTLVDAPRALEFTDGWAAADGTPDRDAPTSRGRVRLAERDGGTRMELRFTFSSREHMEQLGRLGAFAIFEQSVGQMDAVLAAGHTPS